MDTQRATRCLEQAIEACEHTSYSKQEIASLFLKPALEALRGRGGCGRPGCSDERECLMCDPR